MRISPQAPASSTNWSAFEHKVHTLKSQLNRKKYCIECKKQNCKKTYCIEWKWKKKWMNVKRKAVLNGCDWMNVNKYCNAWMQQCCVEWLWTEYCIDEGEENTSLKLNRNKDCIKCLKICLFKCLSFEVSVFWSVCLLKCLSFQVSVFSSVCLFKCLSFPVSV